MNRLFFVILFMLLSKYSFAQFTELTLKVMNELNINLKNCGNIGQFAEKVLPYNNDLTVIVIPKIGKKEENVYTLDSYVVVVNNKTKKIKHLYFESYKTSGWESDAIFIDKITIDTTKYLVQDNIRAFGVVLHTRNRSYLNPYNSKSISLFIPNGDKLQNILKNLKVYSLSGFTTLNCYAEFTEITKTLKVLKNLTNSFFDIEMSSSNSKIVSTKKQYDCIESKKTTSTKKILKFTDRTYRTQKY